MMFIALMLISHIMEPLQENEAIVSIIRNTDSVIGLILIGTIMTALFQSSALFAGLVLLLASAGFIDLRGAILLIFGSNIGTTATAIIASITATIEAKKVALSHALFNILGVVIFLPFMSLLISTVEYISSDLMQQIVNVHFIFNIVSAIIGLLLFKPFYKSVEFLAKRLGN
jgi:phosphate:Na+ symporter